MLQRSVKTMMGNAVLGKDHVRATAALRLGMDSLTPKLTAVANRCAVGVVLVQNIVLLPIVSSNTVLDVMPIKYLLVHLLQESLVQLSEAFHMAELESMIVLCLEVWSSKPIDSLINR